TVCMCARDVQKLEDAKAEIAGAGGNAMAVIADVSRSGDVAQLIEKTVSALGTVQILVNNAGIGYFAPAHEAPEQSWDAVLDTNLKSVFLVSKAVAPGMIEKRTGHIINIVSIAGKSSFAGGGIYCASKWGVMGLTQCMAEDLRPHGIRVSVICPGSVNTEFSPHTGKDVSKMLQPDDIAHAVETLVTQQPQSFISEIVLRPTQKP
ncbi:MAG TPA: SDR family NAD(P)-dependent oxidoreductase, partial [Candidatus Acidoferrales bacterium]|nr:SDR family NAD(P)-dependent oxidoreductase [Candidatus Acidoferrales bacterium]